MRFIVKKEMTGRIGQRRHCREVANVKYCDSWEEAFEMLGRKRKELTGPRFSGRFYGEEKDFYIVLQSHSLDCILHFWIEQDNNDRATASFTLNKVEDERLHLFVEEHRRHGKCGSSGEFVRVFFCPTLAGTVVQAECIVCGETEDLTDYDAW